METLAARTITQGLGRMGLFNFPEQAARCDAHGSYTSMKTPAGWSRCPECQAGLMRKEEERQAEELSAERNRRRADHLLGRAAIPGRFADRRLSTFVPHCPGAKKALDVATAYVSDFSERLRTGASLIFCGGVGAGKTHLAVGIAHEVIAQDRVAVFSSVIGAVRSVKDTYRRDSQLTESEAIENLVSPDLLILDEVGVQFGSDTEKLILFEIINGRYESMKPTIVISNLDREGLEAYLGERAFDRLREGGGRAVVFDWPSFRRQVAA